jgi:hypothetical protein
MKALRWIGIALVVIGVGGFFTVADDLRHKGELMGVGTILVLGLVALAISWPRKQGHKPKTERSEPQPQCTHMP